MLKNFMSLTERKDCHDFVTLFVRFRDSRVDQGF
jgi:hypothetical protein